MGESLILIQQGDPVIVEQAVTFIGIGSSGDRSACRRLVFPSVTTPAIPPLVYSHFGICANPDRTFNLDNDVLTHPIVSVDRTLSSTRVTRFETTETDVIVTELWEGGPSRAATTTALFRQFYDYLRNSALLGPTDFITWEPRDRNAFIYQVELLSLTVGSGSEDQRFDLQDFLDPGGLFQGGDSENALDAANVLQTGWIDREMELRMRIVAKVA